MRKTPYFIPFVENKGNSPVRFSLTHTRAYPIIPTSNMTDGSNNGAEPRKRIEAGITYNLRFNSKAQKKRIEDAASKSHKTLRDFLLDLADAAAAQFKEAKAS